MHLTVRVKPNAKVSRIISSSPNEITVALHAPATEGKANEALIAFLADYFDVPKNSVAIKRGLASRTKVVEIVGAEDAALLSVATRREQSLKKKIPHKKAWK